MFLVNRIANVSVFEQKIHKKLNNFYAWMFFFWNNVNGGHFRSSISMRLSSISSKKTELSLICVWYSVFIVFLCWYHFVLTCILVQLTLYYMRIFGWCGNRELSVKLFIKKDKHQQENASEQFLLTVGLIQLWATNWTYNFVGLPFLLNL